MNHKSFYKKLKNSRIECTACNHRCKISVGNVGICGVRKNEEREFNLLVNEKIIAGNIDPIEKKPLYHFFPGSKTLSLGTLGCNFRCSNCQNYDISQIMGYKGKVDKYDEIHWGEYLPPKEIISVAKQNNCKTIAYTYNEPTIWVEYALAIMKEAKKNGLYNVWVSNGFMTEDVIKEVAPYLDAINIDVKSTSNEFYKKNCGASADPIFENIHTVKERGIHLEITTLVIPTLSDDPKMLKDLAQFIYEKLGKDTPWHISAFSSEISWKLKNIPNTEITKLKEIYDMAKKTGLEHIYIGNVPAEKYNNTYCPKCQEPVILRTGYDVVKSLDTNKCLNCHKKIQGVYE